MSFMAAALPSLLAGAFSAFGPGAGAARKQQKLQNQVMQNQLGIMNQLHQYANSSVGSDPLENAQFANQRAELGGQQAMQRNDLMGQFNRNQLGGSLGDFMGNLNSNFTAQQMALNANNVLNAMQQRRQSLLQSAQVGQQVPNYAPPTNGLPELFGSLAQSYAQYQEQGRQSRQNQAHMAMLQKLLQGGGAPGTTNFNGVTVPIPPATGGSPLIPPSFATGQPGTNPRLSFGPSGFPNTFATPPTYGNYSASRG